MDANMRKLYLSHLFNSWDERMFEFASYIFIIDAFKDTLLPSSIYGFVTTGTGILFSSYTGKLVDRCSRLRLVMLTIAIQKVMIFLSCAGFLLMDSAYSYHMLALVTALSSVARLASVANTIAVEKDWVATMCDSDSDKLSRANAIIRRIDLLSKMLAPMFVSFLIGANDNRICLALIGAFNVLGLVIETILTKQIFNSTPELSVPRVTEEESESHRSWVVGWKIYTSDVTYLASISIAMLYLTVLNFAGTMISYLKWFGYSDFLIASIRATAVVMGLVATFIQPAHVRRFGTARAALHFIWMQTASLMLVLATFYMNYSNTTVVLMLSGVALSRIGLWGFDLSQTQIMQESVDPNRIGLVFGYQYMLCNIFEILQYVLTMVWSDPRQFHIPATISVAMVFLSAMAYSRYSQIVRGHLFHFKTD